MRRLRGVALAATALGVGCSASIGSDSTVSASGVEEPVAQAIADQGGTGVSVECPDDLDGTVDASIECEASTDTGRSRARVTSVEGSDVGFDISAVPYLTAEETAQQASEQLAEHVGESPPEITCPDELVGEVGTTLVCTLTDAGQTYDTPLTVTADASGSIGLTSRSPTPRADVPHAPPPTATGSSRWAAGAGR